MKALVYSHYGTTDELHLEDVPRPIPKPDEVLVKLRAVGVNLTDWEFLTGSPAYARLNGLIRPKKRILGSDVAGVVEAVGHEVTRFQPGDEVFADLLERLGGFAEYTCARQDELTSKPPDLSFVQAAAIPQPGVIAVTGILDKGKLRPGQHVLINGAGGSTGVFAIPLAKHLGAEVTGVDSGRKLDLMRSVGADHVIDYQQQDFTRVGKRYDLVLDLVASRGVMACRRALEPGGRYLAVGGPLRTMLNIGIIGGLLSLVGRRKVGVLAMNETPEALESTMEVFAQAGICAVIDKSYPLEQAAEAIAYHGRGEALGKVVVTMD